MRITHPFCPCCGKKIPLHFLWSAGLHARHCPCCDKNIRLRRPKTFGLGFIAVTLSWLPGQTATGHPLLATLAIAIALFGGLALLSTAVSAGFAEEDSSQLMGFGRS